VIKNKIPFGDRNNSIAVQFRHGVPALRHSGNSEFCTQNPTHLLKNGATIAVIYDARFKKRTVTFEINDVKLCEEKEVSFSRNAVVGFTSTSCDVKIELISARSLTRLDR